MAAAAELLGLVFLAAGVRKLREPAEFRAAFSVVAPRLPRPLQLTVPAAELALGVLLLSGAAPRAAAVVALLALAALSGALVVLRRRAPGVPCGCFGSTGRDAGSLRLNSALALVALAAALWPAPPWTGGAAEALGQATVVAGVLCAWTVARAFATFPRGRT
jgi:uncharacterized membrane protein YphA (DoxX/SURF4 family)